MFKSTKDTHRYKVILQNIYSNPILKTYAEPYQKYIAFKNNIEYGNHQINYIDNTAKYDIIVGLSDYALFNHIFFLNFITTNLLNYYLIIPKNISMPLELTPFIAKSSRWFRDFVLKYQQSKVKNLDLFVKQNNLVSSNLILFSDDLLGVDRNTIIEDLIDWDIESIKDRLRQNNNVLGLL